MGAVLEFLSSVRTATIVAPHPDDETIGAFGLIADLRTRGTDVQIVVVSDGSASHRNSRQWPKPKLIAQRQSETLAAMALAGINQSAVSFLGLPDGGLHELTHDEKARIVASVVEQEAPDLLVIPDWDDAHPDHRAVAAALRGCVPRKAGWSYRVWPAGPDSENAELRYDLGEQQPLKRHALAQYKSQLGMICDDPTGFTISRALLEQFAGPTERFRKWA